MLLSRCRSNKTSSTNPCNSQMGDSQAQECNNNIIDSRATRQCESAKDVDTAPADSFAQLLEGHMPSPTSLNNKTGWHPLNSLDNLAPRREAYTRCLRSAAINVHSFYVPPAASFEQFESSFSAFQKTCPPHTMASSLLTRSAFNGLRTLRFAPRVCSRVAARFMCDVSALEGTDDDLGTVVAREIAYEKVCIRECPR